ncbi:RNA polymerase sigma factor SigZ [Tengunoibacter tsumagoiensis]|uniref:RNA polymerase sigma factor SigZ n=1 Tax=Tengunoibacter tsumagoiensis TaxID=2014871 RepID=A0A402A723_9CHLR|nr:RNA polymerase sigma factor SigZ [Tengunoibacter tsumagoiensis]GCE14934.1 RNA polymerase sigma factor SigZ [Tengunoibacter tsumagoiensis]
MAMDVTEYAWYALHEPLRAFLRKRVRHEEAVEDLLQDVFLRIHMHADTLRDGEKLESWIYQIARHRVTDYYRRQKFELALNETNQDTWLVDMPEDDMQAELAPSVAAMVNALPEPYREALYLTEYQGLSQRDLATRLGLSFSGAKSRVQRAREKLKQLLLDCCHFEFDRLGRIIDYQSRCSCCATATCQTEARLSACCVPAEEGASRE